jgi:hypothetical protein
MIPWRDNFKHGRTRLEHGRTRRDQALVEFVAQCAAVG